MKLFGDFGKEYGEKISERQKTSKIYSEHQLVGLEIADILNDKKHKALYIKLAKTFGRDRLIPLAKSVAEKKEVKNKGAYFMKVLYSPTAFPPKII